MFKKVLIANRGAIACRIERTLRRMEIMSVAVYSAADSNSLHVFEADEAIAIGPAPAAQSYLSFEKILDAAKQTGADAIHPGYGFLSENVQFARACTAQGISFIGPEPEHIEAFALKHTARETAKHCGVPLLPGTGLLFGLDDALAQAERLTYPVMLKSSGGGGGIGMRFCLSAQQLSETYDSVLRLSRANFGDSGVYLERYVAKARHIEVQIFGDGKGQVIALGERDCSAQRRHQKVLEETPAPGLTDATREKLCASAILLGKAVNYASAGTVEFIYDDDTGEFYFLEVNTRLQVEHGVTEQVTGIDLVEWMVLQASGDLAPLDSFTIRPVGASIEARVYAEDPAQNFQPSPGKLTLVNFPGTELARVETWIESGSTITPYYDPMIAKIIVTGKDRTEALAKLGAALDASSIDGTETNLRYLREIAASPEFVSGKVTTSFLSNFAVTRNSIEILDGGTQTTIQDYPGRTGYWNIGVPPSGPMDHQSFRIANRLVGNNEGAAAIEFATMGGRIRFHSDALISLTGADMGAKLNGSPINRWTAIEVKAGSVLSLGASSKEGIRSYLALQGGIDTQPYLGSRSTFLLGGFGGHAGRALRSGDVVHLVTAAKDSTVKLQTPAHLPALFIPTLTRTWEIGVLFGPHAAPDFFTEEDIETLFTTHWKVHYQSDRTGVRLVGPKPKWARPDGGEAGLHPSNIHDNAYAIGTIDFTGDMPILLGPDGPSLGGFVCPATIVQAELWKLGQLKAGDLIRFRRITLAEAEAMERAQDAFLENFSTAPPSLPSASLPEPAVIAAFVDRPQKMVFRTDGDKYLLVEYGKLELDLYLRFRVHILEQNLRAANLAGIIDITPGVRSLHIHYDSRKVARAKLIELLDKIDRTMPELSDITVPSRIVHLPLSWDDPQAKLAQQKYMQAVRPDAPWCPSNIEFIRRINGLESIDEVYRIVHAASYLVLGLGDVYLGAPVATPVDPRHRLVTTKYNPARTWTPENAVGIGGAYMCVYGMEGPGGYQLVGRTIQVWNTWKSTPAFAPGTPWSLRFFDQIRFYPVSAEELLEAREKFPHGQYELRVEETTFNLKEYQKFLDSISEEAAAFKKHQKESFNAERERWQQAGLMTEAEPETEPEVETTVVVADGCEGIASPVTASVFQIVLEKGQTVTDGQKLIVLDAMKTEITVPSHINGTIEEIYCAQGALVQAGQLLLSVRPTQP
ncbi:urea carboxylase [Tunturiibacter gelidoferens]|uniref:Urea carboxylase n=1 Tax=Tunturiibacter lichenicola TaxID=2051959 RepID=A0A7Y9T311_9BACT|nr:urea carboxylase [Edaphobacter lichenicola]NYF51762.1 urea carboxylase [Edaphobacter lichenicola]